MSDKRSETTPEDHRAKLAQFIISLKFHYGPTLANLPLDLAVDAMVKVWESCQTKEDEKEVKTGLMADRPRRLGKSGVMHWNQDN